MIVPIPLSQEAPSGSTLHTPNRTVTQSYGHMDSCALRVWAEFRLRMQQLIGGLKHVKVLHVTLPRSSSVRIADALTLPLQFVVINGDCRRICHTLLAHSERPLDVEESQRGQRHRVTTTCAPLLKASFVSRAEAQP
jgi:hypothetical protein